MPRKKKQEQPLSDQELYELHSAHIESLGEIGEAYADARAKGDTLRAKRLNDYRRLEIHRFHQTLLAQPHLNSDLRFVLTATTALRPAS